jgi:hypothetical protein
MVTWWVIPHSRLQNEGKGAQKAVTCKSQMDVGREMDVRHSRRGPQFDDGHLPWIVCCLQVRSPARRDSVLMAHGNGPSNRYIVWMAGLQ